MISVVYFNDGYGNVMVGAFLMRTDAECFIKSAPYSEGYKIAEVDGQWQSWFNIRQEIKE